jgi:hypothetical protein
VERDYLPMDPVLMLTCSLAGLSTDSLPERHRLQIQRAAQQMASEGLR